MFNLKLIAPAFPGLKNNLAPVGLALLDHGHTLPFAYVGRIDISTRLNAESRAGAPSRGPVRTSFNIQILARVKLERGVGREDVEVQLCGWVEEARAILKWRLARVWGDGRRVGV